MVAATSLATICSAGGGASREAFEWQQRRRRWRRWAAGGGQAHGHCSDPSDGVYSAVDVCFSTVKVPAKLTPAQSSSPL